MLKIKGFLRKPQINVSHFREVLAAELNHKLQTSAHAWLNTALNIIPVWSGASHSTFSQLAGLVRFPLSIAPKVGVNSMGLGRSAGKGELTQNKRKMLFTFRYETDLWHLIYNEFNNANANPKEGRLFASLHNPGPYQFQKQAQAAFETEAGKVRLPNPFRYIDITEVKL